MNQMFSFIGSQYKRMINLLLYIVTIGRHSPLPMHQQSRMMSKGPQAGYRILRRPAAAAAASRWDRASVAPWQPGQASSLQSAVQVSALAVSAVRTLQERAAGPARLESSSH